MACLLKFDEVDCKKCKFVLSCKDASSRTLRCKAYSPRKLTEDYCKVYPEEAVALYRYLYEGE